jgi:hypothetical protein
MQASVVVNGKKIGTLEGVSVTDVDGGTDLLGATGKKGERFSRGTYDQFVPEAGESIPLKVACVLQFEAFEIDAVIAGRTFSGSAPRALR